MPTYQSRSQTLHYTIIGPDAGRTVVLLHGFTNFSSLWMPQALALAYGGYRVLLPDLAGHGLSQPAAEPTTVDQLAADVLALLDTEDVAAADVCGLSLGGMVTLTVAATAPERVRRVVVAGCSARTNQPAQVRRSDEWIQMLESRRGPIARLEHAWPLLCTEAFRRSAHGRAYYATWASVLERLPGSSLANVARGMQRYDLSGRLKEIRCPTLVIVGRQDQIVPPEATIAVQQAIAGAELVELDEAGHLATLDAPLEVTAAVTEFLDRD